MTVNELTIGKHSPFPDTFTAAYDGTEGPRRRDRDRAEQDYRDANAATGDIRTAIENYGRDSAIFRTWSKIHPDFRSNYEGNRHCLALDTRTGASVLARWHGPDALPPVQAAPRGATVATPTGAIIAQTQHHTLTY